MASKALFDRLFIFPKERYNMYIGPHMIYTPIFWGNGNDDKFLVIHSLTVKDWGDGQVDCYEWEFTEQAWSKAEVLKNKIYIEDTNGDEIILTFWEESEMIL